MTRREQDAALTTLVYALVLFLFGIALFLECQNPGSVTNAR